jgi:hypothetical protein
MPQAIDRSLATPITTPRFPAMSVPRTGKAAEASAGMLDLFSGLDG